MAAVICLAAALSATPGGPLPTAARSLDASFPFLDARLPFLAGPPALDIRAPRPEAAPGAAALLIPVNAGSPPIDKQSETVLRITTSGDLEEIFEDLDYSYQAVRDRSVPVPRLFLAELPDDITELASTDQRKSLFFGTLLPVVLRVNEQIRADREQLERLRDWVAIGGFLTYPEQVWLQELSARYELAEPDFDELMRRVDVIPPSMALAQAAVESGWGTSRLARHGNALFGQVAARSGIRTADGNRYAAFDQLLDCATAYAMNLNTHPAYEEFRALRAQSRNAGRPLSGTSLLAGLDSYSELGQRYIEYVRGVIESNELELIDRARLAAPEETVADAAPI